MQSRAISVLRAVKSKIYVHFSTRSTSRKATILDETFGAARFKRATIIISTPEILGSGTSGSFKILKATRLFPPLESTKLHPTLLASLTYFREQPFTLGTETRGGNIVAPRTKRSSWSHFSKERGQANA